MEMFARFVCEIVSARTVCTPVCVAVCVCTPASLCVCVCIYFLARCEFVCFCVCVVGCVRACVVECVCVCSRPISWRARCSYSQCRARRRSWHSYWGSAGEDGRHPTARRPCPSEPARPRAMPHSSCPPDGDPRWSSRATTSSQA